MFYYLSHFNEYFGPLRLFEYITFRAGGAAATAFLIVALFGGRFAAMLRNFNIRAAARYEGVLPADILDKRKNSTPCMGGILLVGGVLAATLLWSNWSASNGICWILMGGTLGFALIGFLDDFLKVFKQKRDGLPGKLKLAGQFLTGALVLWLFWRNPELERIMSKLVIPFLKEPVDLGSWYWLLPVFSVAIIIVGASNAVNLTDGKDGLASGCTIFCALSYAVFTYLMGHQVFASYLDLPYIKGIGEAVVFAAALGGGCVGFLWHNCHPASMFMGDTGSLALGGAIGMLAVLSRQEILLALIGGVYVMEIISVMLQVASFKLTGKRIFLCTPIHHHFERKGWTETQIVVRFWILSGIFALMALATLKLR
ncbi:MAG: phospho-N-acetylmuramoyl-pentapeptide-transferase [Lentisphaeria bacterium]|nr:phospho-N-acetylmuramoyl-pentapeptide-transferase [Lentisphaeria bacterium]